MSLLIRNGRVIDPANNIDDTRDVAIKDGQIISMGQTEGFSANKTIDAQGKIVCPGLIDLQARLREPGQEHKATMESECRAAVRGGITTLCIPPDTYPVIDTPAMAHLIHDRSQNVGLSKVYPLGALTTGLQGDRLSDMAALSKAGCIALSNANLPVTNTLVMRRAMQYAASFNLTVFLNAQDAWLQGNGCVHEGEISTRLGLPAIPEAAEIVGVARDLALIETTGVRAHFCQLSSARAVAMIAEAQSRGLNVTADVTAHHLHLSEHDIGLFNTQCFVLPPLRSATDRDALRQALSDGVISAVCSDHQPHGADAKLAPFSEAASGITGLETLLVLMLQLVNEDVITFAQAIKSLCTNPSTILKSHDGTLSIGASADVCIFDPDKKWTLTENELHSRGKNSPFIGREFTGKVSHTVIGGQVVYDDT